MEKAKKEKEREQRKKRQKVLFRTWLILNNVTQKQVADELKINSSAISNMMYRGRIYGVFAEWWNKNINNEVSK